jgi:hypothetical protein
LETQHAKQIFLLWEFLLKVLLLQNVVFRLGFVYLYFGCDRQPNKKSVKKKKKKRMLCFTFKKGNLLATLFSLMRFTNASPHPLSVIVNLQKIIYYY